MFVAPQMVARLGEPLVTMGRFHSVARLMRTIFNDSVCDAITNGASQGNSFPRACLWLISASKWRNFFSSVSSGFEMEFQEEIVMFMLLHKK
jgi:hypothetical protein